MDLEFDSRLYDSKSNFFYKLKLIYPSTEKMLNKFELFKIMLDTFHQASIIKLAGTVYEAKVKI